MELSKLILAFVGLPNKDHAIDLLRYSMDNLPEYVDFRATIRDECKSMGYGPVSVEDTWQRLAEFVVEIAEGAPSKYHSTC